ncbi:hypothetical protein [Streptomyces sp. NBC_00893]|uniref:hypothetical protein n=1 Tax=Streptomyces sp. NBC_00893 TaxID=2975862 RepID=UPI00224E2A2D|nr:hypothetical protein [Streptomyces sp. NBC_00893]MCX4844438.1 hypothetical protein [Streptomyces sp. NBC_00893]
MSLPARQWGPLSCSGELSPLRPRPPPHPLPPRTLPPSYYLAASNVYDYDCMPSGSLWAGRVLAD